MFGAERRWESARAEWNGDRWPQASGETAPTLWMAGLLGSLSSAREVNPVPCSSRSTITLVSTVIKACPRMGMPRSDRDQQCRAKTRQAGLDQRPDQRAQQRSAPFTHGPGRGSSPRIHRLWPINGCRSTHGKTERESEGTAVRRQCGSTGAEPWVRNLSPAPSGRSDPTTRLGPRSVRDG